jgi:hypothetical protein
LVHGFLSGFVFGIHNNPTARKTDQIGLAFGIKAGGYLTADFNEPLAVLPTGPAAPPPTRGNAR